MRRAWRSGIKEEPRRQPRWGTAAEPGPMRSLCPWDALVGGVPGKNLRRSLSRRSHFQGAFEKGARMCLLRLSYTAHQLLLASVLAIGWPVAMD